MTSQQRFEQVAHKRGLPLQTFIHGGYVNHRTREAWEWWQEAERMLIADQRGDEALKPFD